MKGAVRYWSLIQHGTHMKSVRNTLIGGIKNHPLVKDTASEQQHTNKNNMTRIDVKTYFKRQELFHKYLILRRVLCVFEGPPEVSSVFYEGPPEIHTKFATPIAERCTR